MEITFYRKNVWGNEMMYIADEKIATYISRLTNKKTIDGYDMHNLKGLGFTFEEVLAPHAA